MWRSERGAGLRGRTIQLGKSGHFELGATRDLALTVQHCSVIYGTNPSPVRIPRPGEARPAERGAVLPRWRRPVARVPATPDPHGEGEYRWRQAPAAFRTLLGDHRFPAGAAVQRVSGVPGFPYTMPTPLQINLY